MGEDDVILDCKNICNSGRPLNPLCVILDSAHKGTKRLIVIMRPSSILDQQTC